MRFRFPGRAVEPPDPDTFRPASILLASEGSPIATRAVEFTARLARRSGAPVHVLSIARIWGSAFGLPHPGLLPTKREWNAQLTVVAQAVTELKNRGVRATGQVLGARDAEKQIVAEAKRRDCDAIVMGAGPPRHWLIADFLWSQEPYRVRRRARVPVYLVPGTGDE